MNEVEESGHHDLCFLSDPPSQECICERLKQAENYARIAVMHTVDVDSYEQGNRDCKATHPVLALKEITRIASKGYDAGLDAAREAVAKTHQPIPVIECACGWGVSCPECAPESNRIVGSVCRVCCDDWGDHGYCDDMHEEDGSPLHHPAGAMWNGPHCPVIALIDALKEQQ